MFKAEFLGNEVPACDCEALAALFKKYTYLKGD